MTYKDRLLEEHAALADKLTKLSKFMDSDACVELPAADVTLLLAQESHMTGYIRVLETRMTRADVVYKPHA
jgi:hypothetical protein